MQLSMCDAGTLRVKKNTINNNFRNLSPIPLLLIVSRGMAYCDTWITRVLSFHATALLEYHT